MESRVTEHENLIIMDCLMDIDDLFIMDIFHDARDKGQSHYVTVKETESRLRYLRDEGMVEVIQNDDDLFDPSYRLTEKGKALVAQKVKVA